MPINQSDLNQIKELLNHSNNIWIVTHKNPSIDSIAACLGLYLSLPAKGKNVNVFCPDKLNAKDINLVGIDKFRDSVGENKNFVISLDYEEGSIEKVSYNIKGDKFNLVIEPRPGFLFSEDKVSISQATGKADLVFNISVPNLSELKAISDQVNKLMDQVKIINIDTDSKNGRYGKINLVYSKKSSVSEIITMLIKGLSLPLTVDVSANLLKGIKNATKNFTSPQTTAETLEVAASLMRTNGGRDEKTTIDDSKKELNDKKSFSSTTIMPQQPIWKKRGEKSSPQLSEGQELSQQPSIIPKKEEAPPDWLKPKILTSKREDTTSQTKFDPSRNQKPSS